MRNPATLADDGFSTEDIHKSPLGIAVLSLRIGLRAYFSTYQSMRYNLRLCDPSNRRDLRTLDFNHFTDYWESYSECILHLHHFFELLVKQILRAEHPLLAVDTSREHELVYRLAKRKPVADSEQENLKSLEFSAAFERLVALKGKTRNLARGKPLVDSQSVLRVLNGLRNRLAHRGRYLLRASALDELVGGYVLPLVQKVTRLPPLKSRERGWRYTRLDCGIDPVAEIAREYRRSAPRFRRVAILKELARAAYSNPVLEMIGNISPVFGREELQAAEERAASNNPMNTGLVGPRSCPVCGACALLGDLASEDVDGDLVTRVWRITCLCCGFELLSEVRDPRAVGLRRLDNYWDQASWW